MGLALKGLRLNQLKGQNQRKSSYLEDKKSMEKVIFHFSKSTGSIKIFLNKPWDKFVNIRIFRKIFRSMSNFLELKCLVNDLDKVDMELGNEKKKLFITFLSFLLKNCGGWLKLMICYGWLVITYVKNNLSAKKMTAHRIKLL